MKIKKEHGTQLCKSGPVEKFSMMLY